MGAEISAKRSGARRSGKGCAGSDGVVSRAGYARRRAEVRESVGRAQRDGLPCPIRPSSP